MDFGFGFAAFVAVAAAEADGDLDVFEDVLFGGAGGNVTGPLDRGVGTSPKSNDIGFSACDLSSD